MGTSLNPGRGKKKPLPGGDGIIVDVGVVVVLVVNVVLVVDLRVDDDVEVDPPR